MSRCLVVSFSNFVFTCAVQHTLRRLYRYVFRSVGNTVSCLYLVSRLCELRLRYIPRIISLFSSPVCDDRVISFPIAMRYTTCYRNRSHSIFACDLVTLITLGVTLARDRRERVSGVEHVSWEMSEYYRIVHLHHDEVRQGCTLRSLPTGLPVGVACGCVRR